MARVIVVKNWDRFQHYKDRDPPWIKFYRDTLTSEVWVLGTDTSRLLQIASTLLAARYSNRIPLNFGLIRKVASIDCTIDEFNAAVEHLVAHEFLEIQGVDDSPKPGASDVLASCTSEAEQRQRESRAETEPMSAPPTPIVERGTSALDAERQTADAIERVFDHWQRTHGHAKATLDKGRRRLIRERLKSYTADDLCASISGFLNSPHHMGQNDRGTRYDSLELLLRDSKHVDMGLGFCARPGRSGPETANDRIERALQRMEGTNGRTYDA